MAAATTVVMRMRQKARNAVPIRCPIMLSTRHSFVAVGCGLLQRARGAHRGRRRTRRFPTSGIARMQQLQCRSAYVARNEMGREAGAGCAGRSSTLRAKLVGV